jgi:hypothetical protein
MNRVQVISIGSVVLLALGLAGGKSVAAAVPEPKLLTGAVWQRMSADAKVTYILAVAQRILCDVVAPARIITMRVYKMATLPFCGDSQKYPISAVMFDTTYTFDV